MKILVLILLFFCGCFPGELSFPSDSGPVDDIQVPSSFSWTEADPDGDGVKKNYVTSIKNQMCGDCYIYSALGTLEIQYQIDYNTTIGLDLSEQNIHNCLRISCDRGGDNRNIYRYIEKYGVIQEIYSMEWEWGFCENCMPFLSTPTGYTRTSNVPFFKLKWRMVVNMAQTIENRRKKMVEALLGGPLAMHFSWGFERDEKDKIFKCVNNNGDGHSVVVVGYINYGEYFLVKNSHGGKDVIKLQFEGSEKCNFGAVVSQIIPGSTKVEIGTGVDFCSSKDDWDKDGIADQIDNCPYDKNADQANKDGDMLGDVCDPCPESSSNGYYC